MSSFIQVCISLNDNLINLYEYEAYKLNQKIFHMHHDITQHNKLFNLYKMKPSKDYYINMFFWKNTEEQRKLLFSENCKHDFRKVLYHKPSFPWYFFNKVCELDFFYFSPIKNILYFKITQNYFIITKNNFIIEKL